MSSIQSWSHKNKWILLGGCTGYLHSSRPDSLFQMHTAAGLRGPGAQAFCTRHIVLSPFLAGADVAQHRLSLCGAGTAATAQRKAHDVPRSPGRWHQDLLFNCPTLHGMPQRHLAPLPECPGKTPTHHIDLALVQEPSRRSTLIGFVWGLSAFPKEMLEAPDI